MTPRKCSRISYFEYTTNEPGRRQSSEVAILTDPLQRGILRTSGLMEQEWTGTLDSAGATNLSQPRASAQQGPAQLLELQLPTAHSLRGITHEHTFEYKDSAALSTRFHSPTSYFHHPTIIHAGSREPTQQGYYLSEVCQIEGAETPKPR